MICEIELSLMGKNSGNHDLVCKKIISMRPSLKISLFAVTRPTHSKTPTQNILWPFQRNKLFNLRLFFSFVLMFFY